MFHVDVSLKLPFLWGRDIFKKNKWKQLNLIVGPNGSGKTLLASELAKSFKKNGYTVNYLRSEREKKDSYIEKIKDNEAIRSKIEFVLSNMFGKSIRFAANPDGQIIPIVVNKERNVEYNLQDAECHGLKEILSLLTALYAQETTCLILDEPELHLHPQFQQFFINEIRKACEENKDRIFFLITHSPYFIDLRTPEELHGVIVCHINKAPSHIQKISKNDGELFRRFLPRFNTYHKQFFFSDNQIFVEGYTDQQIFTHLLPCIDSNSGYAGTGIIDVGGKDELGVFFKVCSLLGTDSRIITDLDSLFCGKLREVLCDDKRVELWIEKQYERQIPFYKEIFPDTSEKIHISLRRLITRLESQLIAIGKIIYSLKDVENSEIIELSEKIKAIYNKYEKPENLDTFKTVVLEGITQQTQAIKDILPDEVGEIIPAACNLYKIILAAAEFARVYILPRGCIEHYYTVNKVRYMPVQGKDRLFHNELEYILKISIKERKNDYKELVELLNRVCSRTLL